MKNIIIVDDMPQRHEGFRLIFHGHNLTHCWTYSQALFAFRKQQFDMACLDHDLADFGHKVEVESLNFKLTFKPDYYEGGMYSKLPYDGADICVWLRDNPQFCPRKILIHSHNPDGAKVMHNILSSISTIEELRQEPFRAPF